MSEILMEQGCERLAGDLQNARIVPQMLVTGDPNDSGAPTLVSAARPLAVNALLRDVGLEKLVAFVDAMSKSEDLPLTAANARDALRSWVTGEE